MASNIYHQSFADGTSRMMRRSKPQGRPQTYADPQLIRLRLDDKEKMLTVKSNLGYLYNENEFIRDAVSYYLRSVYTELVNT